MKIQINDGRTVDVDFKYFPAVPTKMYSSCGDIGYEGESERIEVYAVYDEAGNDIYNDLSQEDIEGIEDSCMADVKEYAY